MPYLAWLYESITNQSFVSLLEYFRLSTEKFEYNAACLVSGQVSWNHISISFIHLLEMSSRKCKPFCFGLNVLNLYETNPDNSQKRVRKKLHIFINLNILLLVKYQHLVPRKYVFPKMLNFTKISETDDTLLVVHPP